MNVLANFAGALVMRIDSTQTRATTDSRGRAWYDVMPDTNGSTSFEHDFGVEGSELPRWPPGVSVHRQIVFADLPTGTYEITSLCTAPRSDEYSRHDGMKHGTLNFAWLGRARIARDPSSRPQRTFTVGESSFVYLGQVKHDDNVLSLNENRPKLIWSEGDERVALERLSKERDLEPWLDLIAARKAALGPAGR